ncbi:MAG: TonB-dependent receptor [Acidobacteria bacterium]|nr:TonB-dependent receptor [Acidobacteriota bacterium]
MSLLHAQHFSRIVSVFGLALMCVLPGPAPLDAQVLYGSVVGTIQDQTGAVVPRAGVTVSSKATGLTRETAADDAGRYSLLNILAGTYDLKVSAPGFRTSTKVDVEISINTVTRVDMRLEVGAVSEQVTVAASAAVLQTDKSDVRHEITATAITQLPLPAYRNYQSLIDLVPGATPSAFQNAVVDTPARALTTNINGTARNNNNTLVDGAANTFIWLPHHTYYVQPVESIETVNISTGSFDAEQGMAGGAAITVATKSGTNEIHGVGFWYHNNQHLNSSTAYMRTSAYVKPLTILNQGGGTLSGPVIKNKLFYFASYERTMERTGYAGNYSVAPVTFREGNLSTWDGCVVCGAALSVVYDPATQSGSDSRTRQPFANNIIPKARINPIFDKMQRSIPVPNQRNPNDPNNLGGNYFVSAVMPLNRNMYDLKVNYNATSKLAVWGKYSRMGAPVDGRYPFGEMGGGALGTAGYGKTHVNIPTGGFTYTFSPTFLWDGVFGYTRFDQEVTGVQPDKNVGLDVWGIPGTNGGVKYKNDIKHYGGVPQVTGFGFSDWGETSTWIPVERHERTYEFRTNFSKIHGAHELRWGFEPRRLEMNHWQPETANPRGVISFAGSSSTILNQQNTTSQNSYAGALLGLVGSYNKSVQNLLMKTREWQLGWHVGDRWHVTRKLTLTLGLRYEYYPLINRGDRGIEQWNPYTNIVYLGGINGVSNGITVSKRLFAPRVGFAWRVSDKWVVRSGYGITYDPLPFSRPLRGQYPSTITAGWNTTLPEAENPDTRNGWYNTLNKGIPEVPTPDISKGTLTLPLNIDMGPRSPWGGPLHRGYIQSFNFTIERQLPWDSVANVAYVGTRTIHQMLDIDINTAGPGTGANQQTIRENLPLAKLYGRTNGASMWDGWANGSYNALQASLNKSFSKGLFLKAAYTFSKTFNYADDDGWASVRSFSWLPVLRRAYVPAGYDRTHMLTLGWVYELPVGNGKKYNLSGIADKILGGWKVNGTFAKYSGTAFSVSGSNGSLLCARGCSQTADQIAPVRKIDQERGASKPYFDPMSFRDPLWQYNKDGIYRFGNTGLQILRGPGYWRMHPSIYKNFQVTERVSTEFRAEAFNFTNTPAWGNPNSGSGSLRLDPNTGALRTDIPYTTALGNFMTITGASTGRQFRFGMRIAF